MTRPYLILHKVRGEPAFDIAERFERGEEIYWVVSTSGHRAYPWRYWDLDDLLDTSDVNNAGYHDRPADFTNKLPEDWPDHYAVNQLTKPAGKATVQLTDEQLSEILQYIEAQSK